MKFKTILVLLILAIGIIGIIAPVNSAVHGYLLADSEKAINGKTVMGLSLWSDIDKYDTKKNARLKKAEINKINKISVNIKGYKTINFKKPAKGWKYETERQGEGVFKSFSVKGSSSGKSYTIKCYDKKNKPIKLKSGGKGKVGFIY